MRYAVFVDAGYLYAQGSTALAGRPARREDVTLDLHAVKVKLLETALVKVNGAGLLRIYWYDGLLGNQQTPAQRAAAEMEDVKLRLGVVNEAGQQKGVDALIFSDLIELARNHAISDAVLLSGDEDLRVGVQLAQSFGVRVHLVGIQPSRGAQSRGLIQETDTHSEWSTAEVEAIISLRHVESPPKADEAFAPSVPSTAQPELADDAETDRNTVIDRIVMEYVEGLPPEDVSIIANLPVGEQIPAQFDRILLGTCRHNLDSVLAESEKMHMRSALREHARLRIAGA